MNNKKEIMIEISVSVNGNIPEHEGYYTSAEKAKEAIDFIFKEIGENNE